MPLLLDAWNILHVQGVLPPDLAGLDLAGLKRLLAMSRYRLRRVTIVCDGTPPKKSESPDIGGSKLIAIRYSGARSNADDVIVDLVRRSTAPKRLTVVTSDREIIREVRRQKCRTLTSPRFLRQLVQDRDLERRGANARRPQGKLSDDEVRAWTKQFGVDGELAADLPLPEHLLPPATGSPTSGSKRRRQRKAAPESQPVIPPDLIEEAERLLAEEPPPEDGHSSTTK